MQAQRRWFFKHRLLQKKLDAAIFLNGLRDIARMPINWHGRVAATTILIVDPTVISRHLNVRLTLLRRACAATVYVTHCSTSRLIIQPITLWKKSWLSQMVEFNKCAQYLTPPYASRGRLYEITYRSGSTGVLCRTTWYRAPSRYCFFYFICSIYFLPRKNRASISCWLISS